MEAGQFEKMYQSLNPEQREAVDTIEGPVMVVAGPGTGKTQVLAMRIGKILRDTQMNPENILCLTFTESGVAAMRERLLKIIGEAGYYVRINTFHSFCNDIIGEHPEIFALGPDWQALGQVEKIEIIREQLDGLDGTSRLKPAGNPYMYVRNIAADIKDLKQEGISPEGLKAILSKVRSFLEATQAGANDFWKLKTNERTAAVTETWLQSLRTAASEAPLPAGMVGVVESMASKYEESLEASDSLREQGKARTALKNAVKKWYERLERQLPKNEDLACVYAEYQARIRQRGRYDYEDMIMMVKEELSRNDKLLAQYQEQYQYLLVDEFQDTNGAQNEVMRLWGSFDEQPNIFVVGDDKQSIFRFQGASLANMLDFYRRYPDAKVISLRNNYRSQARVLEVAQAVIAHNEESLARYIPGVQIQLEPQAGLAIQKCEWDEYRTEAEEDDAVARRIKELLEKGVEPKEIAVLFRNNRDGRGLLKQLRQLNVPARLEAGEDALQETAVKMWLKLLEFLSNPTRDDLLGEIIQYEWWGLDMVDTIGLIRGAYSVRKGLWEFMQNLSQMTEAGVKQADAFRRLQSRLAEWIQRSQTTEISQFLREVLDESGWLKWVVPQADALAIIQKTSRILDEIAGAGRNGQDLGVAGFIRQLRLIAESGEGLRVKQGQMITSAVRLMTAHKAKGLEFQHVFLTRLNNNHWGNIREQNKVPLLPGLVKYDFVMAGDNNEDERRLFYVALTRAKQGLYLSRAVYNASDNQTSPTIFSLEWPTDLVDARPYQETGKDTAQRLALSGLQPSVRPSSRELQAKLHAIVSQQVLSATHLNRYLTCPQEYYQRFIVRVPEVAAVNLALGTAVHAALDFAVKEQRTLAARVGTEEVRQVFKQTLRREIRDEIDYQRMLEFGGDMVTSYWEHYIDDPLLPAVGEWNMGRYGVRVGGVPVTGKIDKVELLDPADVQPDGTWRRGARVRVVDYKTSDPARSYAKTKQDGDYWRQLGFYKILCELSPEFPYKVEEYVLDFIQPSSKDGKYVRKLIQITDHDRVALEQTIQKVWKEIQELKFLTGDETPFCGDCWYCELAGVLGNR